MAAKGYNNFGRVLSKMEITSGYTWSKSSTQLFNDRQFSCNNNVGMMLISVRL